MKVLLQIFHFIGSAGAIVAVVAVGASTFLKENWGQVGFWGTVATAVSFIGAWWSSSKISSSEARRRDIIEQTLQDNYKDSQRHDKQRNQRSLSADQAERIESALRGRIKSAIKVFIANGGIEARTYAKELDSLFRSAGCNVWPGFTSMPFVDPPKGLFIRSSDPGLDGEVLNIKAAFLSVGVSLEDAHAWDTEENEIVIFVGIKP